jgi:hypothetical protein
MQLLRKFLFLTLFTLSAIRPAYGEQYYQDSDNSGEAYSQSSCSAHWSAYVPIAVMIAAAIWFGVADGKSDDSSSSNNSGHDGLGSLGSRSGSSHRSSSSSSSSSTYSSSSSSSGYHSH